ncbi:hypothetical protein IOLA_284 [uncultured bacterium]|nr:hypothetical protein IOLA_284 [uncultured bacterium]
MIKEDVTLYSLSDIKKFRFIFHKNYNVKYEKLNFPILIKKSLNVESGFLVNSKKYLKLYLLELAQELYVSKLVEKNKLFFLIVDAILIKNILFILPLSKCEIKIFNDLYKKIRKIYFYSFGMYSSSHFLIKKFFKKIKINLFFYKTYVLIDKIDNLSDFIVDINHDISNIVGDNIFSNRLFCTNM